MSVNEYPIGIFDSGIGGLSSCVELQKVLPKESIVYFGDLLYMPYGEKSAKFLQTRVVQIVDFLKQVPCKAIVIACNTASTVVVKNRGLFSQLGIPILNVIDSTIQYLKTYKNPLEKITVLATSATIKSEIYQKKLAEVVDEKNITPIAAAEWASLIEQFPLDSQELKNGIEKYLPLIENLEKNTVLLACTHYLYIQDYLQSLVPKATFINTSTPVILDVKNLLEEKSILNLGTKKEVRVMTSQKTSIFEKMVAKTFNDKINIKIALH